MSADRLQFGDFELDRAGYELRRSGVPVKMERIPMELLLLLAENPGCLIPRKTLVERVWGAGHFLDEDGAINTAVRKLRQALGDNAEKPRFVETVTGKGYRFRAGAVIATQPRSSGTLKPKPGHPIIESWSLFCRFNRFQETHASHTSATALQTS
jgi:DNA-binding winged helix-turn-helix (wHTH) protein